MHCWAEVGFVSAMQAVSLCHGDLHASSPSCRKGQARASAAEAEALKPEHATSLDAPSGPGPPDASLNSPPQPHVLRPHQSDVQPASGSASGPELHGNSEAADLAGRYDSPRALDSPPSDGLSKTMASVSQLPQPIIVLSVISAALTAASCVFNTLLPVYMFTELKLPMSSMGMFEGLMEAFSYLLRMFSGVISDMMSSRKTAISIGFAMGAAAKFGMSGASQLGPLFAARVVDKLANGIQAAPRDALISDLAPAATRSACFGFSQSLRKWGSAVGAIMSYFLMRASGNDYRFIFTLAASVSLAACLAFVLLMPAQAQHQRPREGFDAAKIREDIANMGGDFYRMLLVVGLYCSSHINESLIEVLAIEVGFAKADSALVVFFLALSIFVSAWPLGRLDDRYGPRVTFSVGMLAHIVADLVIMVSCSHPWAVFASLAFMGVHMGVMNGPLLAHVVTYAPVHLRGTAFGIFYSAIACVAMAANSAFGLIWQAFGAPAAFGASAALTAFTLVGLPWLLPESSRAVRPRTALAS